MWVIQYITIEKDTPPPKKKNPLIFVYTFELPGTLPTKIGRVITRIRDSTLFYVSSCCVYHMTFFEFYHWFIVLPNVGNVLWDSPVAKT